MMMLLRVAGISVSTEANQSTEKTPIFELMMGRLFNNAIKREGTMPFFQTDAGNIENLERYFGAHVPNMVRAKGDEYLAGGLGTM
jgi:hypothetical protein